MRPAARCRIPKSHNNAHPSGSLCVSVVVDDVRVLPCRLRISFRVFDVSLKLSSMYVTWRALVINVKGDQLQGEREGGGLLLKNRVHGS